MLLKKRGEGEMMADSSYDELERRVRTVEEEMNGEKHLTRYAVDQTVRNGEVLLALRSEVSAVTVRVNQLGADMAAVKAALAMHGRALDVLQQDVRQIRNEMTSMRNEMTSMRGEMDSMRNEMAAMRGEMAAMRGEMDSMRSEMTSIRSEMAAMREEVLAAIRALAAAVCTPRHLEVDIPRSESPACGRAFC
jgi:chromosome segregation ATPase